ncbi:hypothetical protein WA026_017864 [Henosepilachna vigintioctopunctata]|uniref:Long-chain-fatty-acid--CoA ligase n=1 Tax=Henosepilachna vigintioctopunctata TaxID=420089 RepID=A0AAW1TX54_9CUCU
MFSIIDIVGVAFLVGIVSTFFLTFQRKSLAIIIKTLPRDLKLIWMFLRLNYNFIYHLQINSTLAKLFRITAKTYPNKIAFHFEDEDWSFERVDILSSKVGQYFKNLGYKRGDSIAILMDSRPEFVCVVLGLAKIGVTAALINVNVVSKDALAHAIRSGNSNSLLYGSRFREVVENLQSVMPELKMFQFNDQPAEILPEASDICSKLEEITDYSLDVDIDAGNTSEIIFFIYTSGTTGLPKASIIRNTRYILGFLTFKLGNFWKDCEKFQCTVSQYIGEMARYVLAAHRKSKEKPTYTLPKMFGNGMKPETWKKFIKTFKVGQIFELYGSTEGNFGLFNLDNTVGSIGYIPLLFDMFAPVLLVKCHPSGEPIKNNQGFCQPCAYNEPGLLLCQVSKIFLLTKFDGYTDKKASEKKLMEGVLRKGDQYFNSGDVMMRDENGYFYFLDRTGDTFRHCR